MTDAQATTISDRFATIAGLAIVLLVIASVVVAAKNRELQVTIGKGQARAAAAQTEANLDNTLIRLLAKAAAEHDNAGIRALLADNGITFTRAPSSEAGTGEPEAGAATGAGK